MKMTMDLLKKWKGKRVGSKENKANEIVNRNNNKNIMNNPNNM